MGMENIRIMITYTLYVRHTTNLPSISATSSGLSLFVAWVVFSVYPSDELAGYHNVVSFLAWGVLKLNALQSKAVLVLVSYMER
jgi:hypothetical protein